jgi:predicted dehydrogenase
LVTVKYPDIKGFYFNFEMTERKLNIACIGLTDEALGFVDVGLDSGLYAVAAVADQRAERAEMMARKYECPMFTDYRQLIVQTEGDFLIFGDPAHQCLEFMRLGLAEGFHVLKTPPPTLNFEQLAELYRLARRQQRLFLTLQNGRFSRPFSSIRDHLLQSKKEDDQSWHLVSAVCHIPLGELAPEMRWLHDPNMAGGGVLLQTCYDLIDELLLCFGLPQKVYALMINQAPDRQQRMSLTEDTAVVAMQFTDTLIAQICASRTLGPARRHLRIHGNQQHLTATLEEVVLYDNDGTLLEKQDYPADEEPSRERLMENLARSILEPSENELYPDHGFDLNTVAVIEAAYLSSRTGMAEDPSRILQLADTDPAGLL